MLDWAKRQSISTPFTASPSATGTPAAGDWYAGRLDVNIVAGAWTLTLIDSWTKITWVNSTVAEEWFGWIPQATATKPQVYDLPLAAGMTARTPCRYSKDQFGRVLVRISLDFPPTVGGGKSFLIATMPEGYRPSSITHAALVGVSTSARRIPAALDAHPNGEMWVFADDSTNILVGEVLLETA